MAVCGIGLPREDKRGTHTPSQVTDIPPISLMIEAIHGHTHILQQKHTIVASRGGCRGTHPTRCKTPVLGRNSTNKPSDPHTRAPPPTPCLGPRTRAPRWVRAMPGHRPPTMAFGCVVHGGDTHVGLLFLSLCRKKVQPFWPSGGGPYDERMTPPWLGSLQHAARREKSMQGHHNHV